MTSRRVLIISPSRYSIYTMCAAERLRRENCEVVGILVRKLLNLDRVRSEWRRDGGLLLKKVWRKLVLRERAYAKGTQGTLRDEKVRLGLAAKTVEDYARTHGIPVYACDDLNAAGAVEFARACRADLAFFTGGGLVRAPLLEACGAGVLNAHLGVLPRYRGMDVVEWPLLEGKLGQLGITVHFMDTGLDTGDLLRVRSVDVGSFTNIASLRDHLEGLLCDSIVTAGLDYLAGKVARTPQKLADGQQYFRMHPLLKVFAEEKLRARLSDAPRP